MNGFQEIDFVVTWVDGADPEWEKKKLQYVHQESESENNPARYRDWKTLRYWFRSVEKYAPWVRRIYFVSDRQCPAWLNLEHPKLNWVTYEAFIPQEYLPTFNSNAIIWNLWRIPGLSEQFVFFNDDVFLINTVRPEDYFVDGLPCLQMSLRPIWPVEDFSYMMFNNAALLNRHFDLRQCMKKHWRKFFSRQSLKGLACLALFGSKRNIPGCLCDHLSKPYKKSTFAKLWDEEYDLLNATCSHKFRNREDVTEWSAAYWQVLSGAYCPRRSIGKCFVSGEMESNHLLDYLTNQRGKEICVNDSVAEKAFEKHRDMLLDAFDKLLPLPSEYEKH